MRKLDAFLFAVIIALVIALVFAARRYLAARRRAAAAQQDADRMKQEIISNVSHELKTPLTPMKGYASLLAKKALTPAQSAAAARQMLEAADQLDRSVDLLVTYTSVRAGEFEPFRDEIDLGGLLRDVVAGRAEGALSHRFDVTVPDAQCRVAANERLLRMTLDQLVDNAIKFSPNGGAVVATLERRDSRTVVLQVRDEGLGIERDKLTEMFEAFTQGDGSATRAFGGMGLGLTFVDEVVKLYRGRVEVDSVPGAGSRFTLVLPLRDPSPVVIRRPRFEPRVHASV